MTSIKNSEKPNNEQSFEAIQTAKIQSSKSTGVKNTKPKDGTLELTNDYKEERP